MEFQCDLVAGRAELERAADPDNGPAAVIAAGTTRAVIRAAIKLGVIGAPPKPPAQEAHLVGHRRSKRRDTDTIAHHYDAAAWCTDGSVRS